MLPKMERNSQRLIPHLSDSPQLVKRHDRAASISYADPPKQIRGIGLERASLHHFVLPCRAARHASIAATTASFSTWVSTVSSVPEGSPNCLRRTRSILPGAGGRYPRLLSCSKYCKRCLVAY